MDRKSLNMLRIILLIFLICFPISITAQPIDELGQVISLPKPKQGGVAGIVINKANATEFRNMLIPELYSLLRKGVLELDAARSLNYQFSPAQDSPQGSIEAFKKFPYSKETLFKQISLRNSFIYGDRNAILKEEDPRKVAEMVLWSWNSILWSQGILSFDFRLLFLNSDKKEREASASFLRIYPSAIDAADKTGQLFRERLRFTSPPAIEKLTFLSFRFVDSPEDTLWLYSPALQKTRELTSSNRGDSILGSGFSMEDLLLFSGKVESMEGHFDKKVLGLVPFVDLNSANLNFLENGCKAVKERGNLSFPRWNFESRRFEQGAGWIPTAAVFVPRELLRIELNSSDPFSLYGRQVIYFDSEMMVPVYKIVFDRVGNLWKILIAGYGLASSEDGKQSYPYQGFIVADDLKEDRAYILESKNITSCKSYSKEIKLEELSAPR